MERGPGGTTGRTGEAKEQAKQQGQQLTRQAREQADELATRGGEQVKTQLSNQKHEASQRLTPIQTALRETGQQLRKQGQNSTAGYADGAADRVERVAGYLRETEVDEMVDEARGFARSRPAVFLGGALALGFLGARFLKSSSQQANGGGDGQPVAALPPAEDDPLVIERTPVAERPLDETDRPMPSRGI